MEVFSKSPKNCSEEEINRFLELVQEGGEVIVSGLRNRILNAEKLVFVSEGRIIGIGAIKHPVEAYRRDVFKEAGLLDYVDKECLEIGWIYTMRSARGKGVGSRIMKKISEEIKDKLCFATTRTNNDKMHYLLLKYGFSREGKDYLSNRGYHKLCLYLKKDFCNG